MTQKIKLEWKNRFDSLEPQALIAFDEAAVRLKAKLLSFDDEKLSLLQGIFAEKLLFIKGKKEDLPWIDGGIYLGKDARAASIYVPTNLHPNIPFDIFEKSLIRSFLAQSPFAVVGNYVIPVGKMRSISRKILSETL